MGQGPFGFRGVLAQGLISLVLAGCGASRTPVVLAAVGGWSGPEEQELRQGIELAVAQVNAAGGRPIRILYRDDRNDNQAAAEIARQLVQDPAVVAVIGHTRSDPTLVAAKVYDGVMPLVVARLTSPDLTGLSRWIFQLVPTDSAYSAAVADFSKQHGWRTAAVLFNNTARGRTTAEEFRRLFKGDVLSMDPAVFPAPLAGDLKIFVAYHKRLAPDVVYVPVGEPKEYIREAQLQRLPSAVIGWDVWAGLSSDASLPGQFFYIAPFDLASPRAPTRDFVTAFRQRYGKAPGPFAALGFDAVGLLATTIARTGPDRRRVRDALAALTPDAPFEGAIGSVSFSGDGNVVGPQPVIVPLRSAPHSGTEVQP